MQYRVRQGFTLHLGDRPPITGGEVVDLTAEQFERHAHQLEPFKALPEPAIPIYVVEPESVDPEAVTEPDVKPRSRKSKENN
jgi:hypothetical protein